MLFNNSVEQNVKKPVFTLAFCTVFCTIIGIGLTVPQVSQAAGDNEWRQAFRDLRQQDIKGWREFKKSECGGIVRRSCKKKFVTANAKAVPELDPNHLGAALLLTAGGVLVVTGRRKTLNN